MTYRIGSIRKLALSSLGPVQAEEQDELANLPEGEYTVEGEIPQELYEGGEYVVDDVEGGGPTAGAPEGPPAEEVPAEEVAEEGVPAEEAPVEEEVPAEEAPEEEMVAEEEVPQEEVAPEERVPEEEMPIEGEAPIEGEVPAEEVPVEGEAPSEEMPVEEEVAPEEGVMEEAPVEEAPIEQGVPVDQAAQGGPMPTDQPAQPAADPAVINEMMEPSADIDKMRAGSSGQAAAEGVQSGSTGRVQPEDDPNSYDQPKVMTGANLNEVAGPEDRKLSEGNDEFGHVPKVASEDNKREPKPWRALLGGLTVYGGGTIAERATVNAIEKMPGRINSHIVDGFKHTGNMSARSARNWTRAKEVAETAAKHTGPIGLAAWAGGAGATLYGLNKLEQHREKTASVVRKAHGLAMFASYTFPNR